MGLLTAVAVLILAADDPRWEPAAETNGIRVFARQKAGAEVRELKAIGLIDATPQEALAVLQDLENYKTNMPYTAESKVVRRENESTVLFYSRLNAPMVAPRDYLIRIVNESKWDDGKGFLKVTWTCVNDQDALEPAKEGVVRVRVNDGHWLLEPREGGKKTFATYYLYTNPGGAVPIFVANQANGIAVPKVFEAIRKAVEARRKKAP